MCDPGKMHGPWAKLEEQYAANFAKPPFKAPLCLAITN